MFVISFFWKATHLVDVDIQQSLRDPSKKGGCIGPAAHIPKFVNASVESLPEQKSRSTGVRNTTAAKPKKVSAEEIQFHILKLDNTSWMYRPIQNKKRKGSEIEKRGEKKEGRKCAVKNESKTE
ncbi:hypothetical protein RUM43_003588 [Polyplax serrata]|uniref:Uncharacterized protein n=1 Tax=Polyplax serrata TaxID=468196 RepID=A0AAN8P3F2_POLSC